jgi:SAM-dependent methyltransferase
VTELHSTPSRFDRRASTYEDSTLQQFLFGPVHQTALQLALQLLPQARRVLDVGCGTGRLLRHARQCYPTAELVGVDLAGRMVAAASAVTSSKLAVRYVHARAERMPFSDGVFDLVFATLSLRHWTNPPAGIAEVARVLTPNGVVVLADIFRSCRHRGSAVHMLRRRPTPSCRPSLTLCWPPTAWRSSAASIPAGSGCPMSKSSQCNSRIGRAPSCPQQGTRPAPLRRISRVPAGRSTAARRRECCCKAPQALHMACGRCPCAVTACYAPGRRGFGLCRGCRRWPGRSADGSTGQPHSSHTESATTASPTASELREARCDWKYHSDGAISSQTPSDRLQRWGQIGWRG